ncbi:unnamed protein product [Adineta steineri]|uniref:Uncharacterized protein n=2 Tax=Adineta steineri TaxID=433720 RepID=A0A819M202_9BILA|nr:unnamed protein product [Adineta steineri]
MNSNNNTDQAEQPFPDKLVISAAEYNKQPILDILLNHIIPDSKPISVLEIGSGTGQHITHFAAHFPLATFQPSDIDSQYFKSIQAYIDEYEINAFTKNILPPLNIDVLSPSSTTISSQSYDFVYCCNMIHITPIECTKGLFALAERVLKSDGSLITYGPYGLQGGGRITPESNRRFHAHLQMQDSRWGLKSIDELAVIAHDHHMVLKQIFDMPSNNKILWWIKKKELKYSDINPDTCNEPDSPWYTIHNTIKKRPRLTTSSISSSTSNRKSSRSLNQTTPMSDSDNDLIVPSKRVVRKKKPNTIVSSDSDDTIIIDDDDDGDESPPKPIKKKVKHRPEITDDKLDIETKKALREQAERDKRIKLQQEREELARLERSRKQKEYNGEIICAHEQKQVPVAFELVLETDLNTNNIIIEVDLTLVQYMKKHQIEGVRFLWNQVFESTTRIKASINKETKEDRGGSGAILAHCMGLGKTFTTITLIHTLFRYQKLTHIHRVLILCPLNTANNWRNEFRQWIGHLEPHINVYLFNAEDIAKKDRIQFLRRWYEDGGILIMGYEMYRLLNYASDATVKKPRKITKKKPKSTEDGAEDLSSSDDDKWLKKKTTKSKADLASIEKYRKYLRSPGPDLIVCDEGHMIKNPKSAVTRMVNEVRTLRRIVLTGTPMQNNLKEYYAMINFCKPNYLGSEHEFSRNFRIPIEAGQHKDSSAGDVAYMRRRAYALNQRLINVLHRRDFDVLRSFLPPKFEYAVKIKCTPLQQELYRTYLLIQNIDPGARLNMAKLLGDYQYLMKIWTHPWLLRPHFIDGYYKYLKGQDQVETDQFFQDDPDEMIDDDEVGLKTQKRTKQVSKIKPIQSITTATPQMKISKYFPNADDEDDDDEDNSASTDKLAVVMKAMKKEWWYDMFDVEQSQFDIELSGKFELFRAILTECESIGDKLLVFTRSLLALDYIEQWLERWSSRASSPKWTKGKDYFRMDGKVPIKQRAADIKSFNEPENTRARLFLISTMAGGIGINLHSANRVIIFDVSWNPAHDLQAMFRSYRLGQKKPVYIYRIIGKATMEEKIYKRQIIKQAMSQRVVDAKQLDRHFTNDELAQLYRFDTDFDNDPLDKYDADRVKDKVLRKLMDEYAELIVSYREHDSLLIHRDEENLTEEERKQAQHEDELAKTKIYGRNKEAAIPLTDDSIIRIIPGQVMDLLRQTTIGPKS